MAKVAVVGAGLIGRAWTISFARAGHDVSVADSVPAALDQALAFVDSVLPDLARYDLLEGQSPGEVRRRIATTDDLGKALAGVVHVQENAPEKIEVKRALFPELDRLAPPDAVLASSTSALLPSAFTESVAGRARCLVVHPINPPYLVPAVEVVPAPWTDPAVVARAADFMTKAGQAPIVMKREIDGFVMNRMQGALLQEAFRLVADGYASIEDVDVGLREGLALRWSFMGPFETIDLNAPGGVRDYVAALQRDLRKAVSLPDPCGRLEGPRAGGDRARPAQAPETGRPWQAPGLARPALDGPGPAQAARGQGHRRY